MYSLSSDDMINSTWFLFGLIAPIIITLRILQAEKSKISEDNKNLLNTAVFTLTPLFWIISPLIGVHVNLRLSSLFFTELVIISGASLLLFRWAKRKTEGHQRRTAFMFAYLGMFVGLNALLHNNLFEPSNYWDDYKDITGFFEVRLLGFILILTSIGAYYYLTKQVKKEWIKVLCIGGVLIKFPLAYIFYTSIYSSGYNQMGAAIIGFGTLMIASTVTIIISLAMLKK